MPVSLICTCLPTQCLIYSSLQDYQRNNFQLIKPLIWGRRDNPRITCSFSIQSVCRDYSVAATPSAAIGRTRGGRSPTCQQLYTRFTPREDAVYFQLKKKVVWHHWVLICGLNVPRIPEVFEETKTVIGFRDFLIRNHCYWGCLSVNKSVCFYVY